MKETEKTEYFIDDVEIETIVAGNLEQDLQMPQVLNSK